MEADAASPLARRRFATCSLLEKSFKNKAFLGLKNVAELMRKDLT